MQEGLLLVDLSVAPVLRVVHRRPAGRGTERRDQRSGDAHLHHAVLPQVRPENNDAGKWRWLSRICKVLGKVTGFEPLTFKSYISAKNSSNAYTVTN